MDPSSPTGAPANQQNHLQVLEDALRRINDLENEEKSRKRDANRRPRRPHRRPSFSRTHLRKEPSVQKFRRFNLIRSFWRNLIYKLNMALSKC